MSNPTLAGLVSDALHELSPRSHGCFTYNSAGCRLFECGDEIIPEIEAVLESEVFPEYLLDESDRLDFLGLDYVLGAFLAVGFTSAPDRARGLIQRMPVDLLVRTIYMVPTFFGEPRGREFLIFSPTEELMSLLRELSSSETRVVSDTATHSLQRLLKRQA